MSDSIDFSQGKLKLVGRWLRRLMPVSAIKRVHLCSMEDEAHHGDEEFHILILEDEFILIGPFVDGALRAIDEMIRVNSSIPVERSTVGHIPYSLREPGLLGLRLFPVAGLRVGKLDRLKKCQLTPKIS